MRRRVFVLSDIAGEYYWTGTAFVEDGFACVVMEFPSLAAAREAVRRYRRRGMFFRAHEKLTALRPISIGLNELPACP